MTTRYDTRKSLLAALALGLTLAPAVSPASTKATVFSPGAAGIGDSYFPLDGNGGYDAQHYLLQVSYNPTSDELAGVATMDAIATQNLSRFNLDLEGLKVRSITVNGISARWSRNRGELTITPSTGLLKGSHFIAVVAYDGIPQTLRDGSGFIHTEDGALVIGQPHVAATWFPVNDHPIDKASYSFEITVPTGVEAVSNGILVRQVSRAGSATWVWDATAPMASYLAMMAIGQFDISAYEQDGIRFWDALDPRLFIDPKPRTGDQFLFSQQSEPSYKRITHTIAVPDEGAQVSFWIDRDTEVDWDYVFVEAHTVGADDWTTLPDLNGHTAQDTGVSCPSWQEIHPFLEHYQESVDPDTECNPTGTTGEWWAASGKSEGYEQWAVDLSDFVGTEVELSISYVSDDSYQKKGVIIDDVVVSVGTGTTSFEADGDTLDGWHVPGAPEGSPPNPNDWIAATVADLPANYGEVATGALAHQGEILDFLSDYFGPYPLNAAGGIVDDVDLGFALENQTRPIYSKLFFEDAVASDFVIVHELAHQWVGDSLALAKWQHIWLNEGFASYTEWLWNENEGLGTADGIFASFLSIPADDSFWQVTIGDPGRLNLFSNAVYGRGAMTLHALRLTIGDDDFFALLKQWVTLYAGGNVTTEEFIALAESISGLQLNDLFQTWLFTAEKPSWQDQRLEDSDLSEVSPAARRVGNRLGAKSGAGLDADIRR